MESNVELLEGIYSHLLEKKKQECIYSFYKFLRYFWDTICPEKYEHNWTIKYLCDELQIVSERIFKRLPKEYDLIINIAPGETKSIIASQMWNAWLWTIDPTIRFLGTSHSDTLSVFNAMCTKDILLSEKYTEMFGEFELKEDMRGKGDFMTPYGGRRKASSVRSRVTGSHHHIKAYDDLVDAEEELSSSTLKQVNNHIDKCWTRNVDSRISINVLIMQRVSPNDPTTYFLSKIKGGVKHIILPSEYTYPINPPELKSKYKNGVLNNKRKPPEVLQKTKQEMGQRKYDTQFGQSPQSIEGKILKRTNFVHVNKYEIDQEIFINKKYLLVDTANTADKKNDPYGILLCTYYNNSLYLLDYWEEHMEAPDALSFISKVAKKQAVHGIYVENKSNGQAVAQMLVTLHGVNAIEYKQTENDKETRLINELDFIDAKRCVIVWSEDNKERMEHFLYSVTNFPSSTVHDESIDVLTMGMRLSRATKTNRQWN